MLVFGAGTDYALLLVSRYREELRRHEDKHEAIRIALGTAGPAILASGLTVMAALLVLILADVNSTAGLGPIGALGVGLAMILMLTMLPAALAIFGRRAFWPFIPYGPSGPGPHGAIAGRLARYSHQTDETHGFWRRVGERVARRPRMVASTTVVILLVLCGGLLQLDTGLTNGNSFRGEVESVQGKDLLAAHFPAGANVPSTVIVPPGGDVQAVTDALKQDPAVADVGQPQEGPPGTQLSMQLKADPYSTEAFDQIPHLRDVAKQAGGEDVLVGGPTAESYDYRTSAARDNKVIIPIALVVVFFILAFLLRAIFAPAMLVGTVILSFGAALGLGVFFFENVFGFPGVDPSLPAAGVRLPRRAGHRLQHLPHGPRARGGARPRHAGGDAARARGDRRGDHVGRHRAGGDVLRARGAAARVPDRDRVRDRVRRAARHVRRALDPRPRADLHHRQPGLVAVVAPARRRRDRRAAAAPRHHHGQRPRSRRGADGRVVSPSPYSMSYLAKQMSSRSTQGGGTGGGGGLTDILGSVLGGGGGKGAGGLDLGSVLGGLLGGGKR